MYLGVLSDVIGVAQLWWDLDPFQRVGVLKRRSEYGWAAIRFEHSEVELRADLRADWVCIWSGDRADARGIMFEAFELFVRDEVADAFKTDL